MFRRFPRRCLAGAHDGRPEFRIISPARLGGVGGVVALPTPATRRGCGNFIEAPGKARLIDQRAGAVRPMRIGARRAAGLALAVAIEPVFDVAQERRAGKAAADFREPAHAARPPLARLATPPASAILSSSPFKGESE